MAVNKPLKYNTPTRTPNADAKRHQPAREHTFNPGGMHQPIGERTKTKENTPTPTGSDAPEHPGPAISKNSCAQLRFFPFAWFFLFLIISSFLACSSICNSSISLIGSSGRPKVPERRKSPEPGALSGPSKEPALPTFSFSLRLSQAFPGELKKIRERMIPM